MGDIAARRNEGACLSELQGKIVLVTGAAGAIGSAIAQAVRSAGGTVVATDVAGANGITSLDVADEAQWQRVVADLQAKHGHLDGLVNAAGIAAVGNIEKTDFATWRRVLSINLDGTFLGCKYAFPLLRKKGGAIVNLSSVLGLIGGPSNLVLAPNSALRPDSRSTAHGHGEFDDDAATMTSVLLRILNQNVLTGTVPYRKGGWPSG